MSLRRLVLSVGTAASLALVTAGAAAAQPTGAAVAHEQGTAHFTVATPAKPGTKQSRVVCHSTTDIPYGRDARILVSGVVSCTGPVPRMTLTVYLRRITSRGNRIVAAAIQTSKDSNTVLATASLRCVNGEYYGQSSVDITGPPGYNPPKLTLGSKSQYNEAITC